MEQASGRRSARSRRSGRSAARGLRIR